MRTDRLEPWLTELARRNHRGLLILAGSADWCRQIAGDLYRRCEAARIWLGDAGEYAVPAVKARQLLGSEYTLAVYDAHSGLHPDALAALTGTVQGGGVLILLVPAWSQWSTWLDPDYARIASYPLDHSHLPRRFIAHVQHCLRAHSSRTNDLKILEEAHEQSVSLDTFVFPAQRKLSLDTAVQPMPGQQQLLEQLVVHDGVAVVLADRGRGKSALLGFAASYWLAVGQRVLLTAPSRQAAATVFRHCENAAPDFLSVDMILADTTITADVLLVDEAAAISLSLLLALLLRFPRVIFATTTDGYEGTGQGFVLRFLNELNAHAPGWLKLSLDVPVRWAADDAVERCFYDLFLLAAHEIPPESLLAATPVSVDVVTQDALLQSPLLLQSVYGLLRSAHYRTTPDDLRFLLDGPSLTLYRLRQQKQTLAVAMIVEEGSLDETMSAEIMAGRRRPRGHMLVQSLAIHLAQPQYLQQRVARVVRIAVHRQWQRSGLGSQLLQAIIDDQRQRGVAAIGSSFSATPEVLAFWNNNGFDLLRIGHRRQAASAAPAALVLRQLIPAVVASDWAK